LTSFVDRSFTNIAAMFFALTFYFALNTIVFRGAGDAHLGVLCRAVYALLVSLLNPLLTWSLQGRHSVARGCRGCWRDQVHLFRGCQPFFLAWAWKDLTQDAVTLVEEAMGAEFWPKILAAILLVVAIAGWEVTPCYRRALVVSKEQPHSTPLWAHYVVQPGHIGLAVGFAWNLVLSLPKVAVINWLETTLFKMMVQATYCLIITATITALTMYWGGYIQRLQDAKEEQARQEAQRQREEESTQSLEEAVHVGDDAASDGGGGAHDGNDSPQEEHLFLRSAELFMADIEIETTHVFLNALSFVYGWALLDTINMLFFSYLLECGAPGNCSNQSNFAFCVLVTVVFANFAAGLSTTVRRNALDKAWSNLFNNALSLNVGWAWMNFCRAAIRDAGSLSDLQMLGLHFLWLGFGWLSMSFLHHRFHVVKRAWDETCRAESSAHGIAFE